MLNMWVCWLHRREYLRGRCALRCAVLHCVNIGAALRCTCYLSPAPQALDGVGGEKFCHMEKIQNAKIGAKLSIWWKTAHFWQKCCTLSVEKNSANFLSVKKQQISCMVASVDMLGKVGKRQMGRLQIYGEVKFEPFSAPFYRIQPIRL